MSDFDRLLQRHKDSVYRQMLRYCGNPTDAEDALSDAILKAYRSLDSLKEREAFRPWLVQIGRRVCGRMKHRQSLRPALSLAALEEEGVQPHAPDPTPEELALAAETKTCLYRALEEIPEPYRGAYVASDLEDKSNQEAAAEAGITLAAYKSRLHRARAMLRERVDKTFCP